MKKLGRALAVVGLLLAASVPGLANTVTKGELRAACSNFTLTFYGDLFQPGESITINWKVVMWNGSNNITESGTSVMAYGGTPQPVLTVTLPWTNKPCGTWNILSGGSDGSRYSWQQDQYPFNSGAEAVLVVQPPDATLTCSCTDVVEICRTPGFWGTHAGIEKSNSQNITQQLIDKVGFLNVCGKSISTTTVNSIVSATEAMCVSVRGDQKLQLARQLTSAALNCVMSGGGSACNNVSVQPVFTECNDVCAGIGDQSKLQSCIDRLDCFNNGGSMLSSGVCQMGTCGGDGVTGCTDDKSCLPDVNGNPVACVAPSGNCHDRLLINTAAGLNFEPPGAAGSSKACNDATKNGCSIFGGCSK